MKKLITLAALLICLTAHAQHAVKDAQGNYHVVKRDSVHTDKPEGHTITDKDGKVHPIYVSVHGKLYWLRTSAKGNIYKCYIKT